MAFTSYKSDREWLESRLKTAFPEGAKFHDRTVKLYLKQGTDTRQFLSQHPATGTIVVTCQHTGFNVKGMNESLPQRVKEYTVYFMSPDTVDAELIVDRIMNAVLEEPKYMIDQRLKTAFVQSGSSMIDRGFDAFELSIIIR